MIKLNPEAISDVGCNIVTGVVLETLAEKKITEKKILINVRTLWRNFVNCLEGNSEQKIKLLKNVNFLNRIIRLFIDDTTVIVNALMEMNMDVIIYYPDYKKVAKAYYHWKDMEEFRGLTYFILSTEIDAINTLKPKIKALALETDHKLPNHKDFYILTHIPLDLLNYVMRNDVYLIESHTGEIKEYNKWYTKFKKIGKLDMRYFAFNELNYQLLGDNLYVKPENLKFRQWYQAKAKKVHLHSLMDVKSTLAFFKKHDIFTYNKIKTNFKFVY